MIKKYDDGEFTQKFLIDDFNGDLVISKPRGKGLSLHDLPEGRVILLAAGTGLYPFSDTIDLLYKEHLVDSESSFANQVRIRDPLVGEKPFKKFKFSLYITVNTIDELHPITLFQCNELTKLGRLICYAKMKSV